MDLVTLWFALLAVLWTGFFFLEGFDFGVGALTGISSRDDAERRTMLATIAPVWDANEVWLVTGGIALFAAFPGWYAAVLPAAYLPMLLVIVSLIVRGISIEYRSRRPEARWRRWWDLSLTVSSCLLPLLFGVFWTGMLHGIPIDADGAFVGRSLWSFINPYSVLGGITLLAFSLAHGSTFLAARATGAVQARQRRLSPALTAAYAAFTAVFTVWTYLAYTSGSPGAIAAGVTAIVGATAALVANARARHVWAFWLNGLSIAAFVAQIFIGLYPNALPSTLDAGYTLTLEAAASGPTTLSVITVVAAAALPLVIAYQAWSLHIFRRRALDGE